MSQSHNIAGSEAFAPGPKIMVSELPRRRAPLPLLVRWGIAIAIVGALVSLIDAAIGEPIGFFVVTGTFLVAWLRG